MLPFANTSIDYLIRTNVDSLIQGRVWGNHRTDFPAGYVRLYAVSGILADYVFTPLLLLRKESFAGSVGKILGSGDGRGLAFSYRLLRGCCLCATAVMLSGEIYPRAGKEVSNEP